MEFKDYYKVLGVAENASQDDIKRSYRRHARKYHPDVSDEPDAEERFKEVGEAYEVLRDPEKRAEYDQLRKGGWRAGDDFRPPPDWEGGFGNFGQGGFGEEDLGGFSDFFESLFGRARRQQGPRRGRDLRARVDIDLETAYAGGTRRITLEQPAVTADGSVVRGSRSLDVKIPAGVRDGQQIRLAGKGDTGPGGGRPGDLYLEVHLLPHPRYEVHERDVHLTLPVAPWEAALGAQVGVPTLGGRVEMNIPAGAASGRRFRLRGRGLPGKPPGDQYVILKIVTPPAGSKRTRELYEQLKQETQFNPRAGMEA